MICMIVMGVIISALTSYAYANNRSTVIYRQQRNERAAGDQAIQSAINWVKSNPKLGRDPKLNTADPACVQYVPSSVGTVTVSCAASAGAGSGTPNQPGLDLPETLLLLGNRKISTSDTASPGDEPGAYNVLECTGWWNTVQGWFSQSGVDPNATGPGEWSAWFKGRKGLDAFGASCNTDRQRNPASPFKIEGNVVSAGRIQVSDGRTVNVTGTVAARNGCGGGGLTCTSPTDRSDANHPVELNYLYSPTVTKQDTDPGRVGNSQNPMNTESPFLPVGFNADGSVAPQIDPTTNQAYTTTNMPSAMPLRTTAYTWDPSSATGLATASGCSGSATTIIFLPGWYRNANLLNTYTGKGTGGANGCKDVTFWFAPNPGPDNKLLTADDQTGAYYFDFRTNTAGGANNSVGQKCQGMATQATGRWCIGDDTDSNPDSTVNARVVAGTPEGWAPMASVTSAPPGSPDTRSRVKVTISTAGTVDTDLSQTWQASPDPVAGAKSIGGTAARYSADICIFGTWCFSEDRAIRVREFTPKVTGPPIDEVAAGALPPAPQGRIYPEVAYAVTNATSADSAKVVITTVSDESPNGYCGPNTNSGDGAKGVYNLFTNKSDADYATKGIVTYKFSDAQAAMLAKYCGTVDLINGLEFKLEVTGNGDNYPKKNDVYFDGVKFSYDTFEGASFPYPNSLTSDPDAKSDCNPSKPGAQFIFGGESHVYVGDGSLEVCAGPYPTDPEAHMSIGVYGLPQVSDLNMTGVPSGYTGDINNITSGYGGTNNVDQPTNPGNATAIDGKMVQINYGGCAAYCGRDYEEGWLNLPMQGYTVPTGYVVDTVRARVAYNPKNESCSTDWLWGCPGAAPQLQFPTLSGCSAIDYPKNPDKGSIGVANWSGALLYKEGASGGNNQCMTPARLAAGATLRWAARAECTDTFILGRICKAGGGQWHDEFDGIALEITLKPSNDSQPRLLPQSGCITAHPNYNAGAGAPDCAIMKADASLVTDNATLFTTKDEGQSRGRMSVKGTIYAPSAAIEIDDTDVAYPLATRGIVARHLRTTGWGNRGTYNKSAILGAADKRPSPRESTFTSCIQSAARRSAGKKCGEDDSADKDKILTKARVRFALSGTGSSAIANVPQVVWWSDER